MPRALLEGSAMGARHAFPRSPPGSMILGSEAREECCRRVAAQATSCQDGQKGRSSLGCECDIACVCERLLVENLDGA